MRFSIHAAGSGRAAGKEEGEEGLAGRGQEDRRELFVPEQRRRDTDRNFPNECRIFFLVIGLGNPK